MFCLFTLIPPNYICNYRLEVIIRMILPTRWISPAIRIPAGGPVYTVKVNTDPNNPRDLTFMDEDYTEELRDMFGDITEAEA